MEAEEMPDIDRGVSPPKKRGRPRKESQGVEVPAKSEFKKLKRAEPASEITIIRPGSTITFPVEAGEEYDITITRRT